jgi:hypothetical protein
VRQDVWWLLGLGVFCVLYRYRQTVAVLTPVVRLVRAHPAATLAGLAMLLFAVAWLGTYLLHHDYNRTLDEVLARSDAQIFGRGQLFATIPEIWRPYTGAMMPAFGLPVADGVAWASSYLPGNAAFQALVGAVLVPQLANPLLSAFAVTMMWSVARKLWPERLDAAVVALLLMLTSTQLLFMAMTSWAMAGHLALTMLWLRLYLRQDVIGHAGCLATGLIACGWHQVAFHALFAAPFILSMWWQRRWTLALFYSAAYTLIGLFWISYGQLAANASGITLQIDAPTGALNFVARVLALAESLSISSFTMMGLNLLRFVAWQNPLLLPLLLVAWGTARRLPEALRLAAAGLVLTLLVVLVVLPYQGHGWGYRYMHAYIGVLCLIAAHAWTQQVSAEHAMLNTTWTPIAAAVILALMVQLPGQAWQVHAMVLPRAAASAAIAAAQANVVIIDPRSIRNPGDLVRNDPFLSTTPIVMDLVEMTPQRIAGLCARAPRVKIFDYTAPTAAGLHLRYQGDPKLIAEFTRRAESIKALPCFIPWVATTAS